MDCIDAIIYTSTGGAILEVPEAARVLARELERAGIELGEVELRTNPRVAEGRALVLLLPRLALRSDPAK